MPRLIDAVAFCEENPSFNSEVYVALSKAPTIEAEPVVHGKWKKEKLIGCEPYYLCSVCRKLHHQDYNFCNNCGAKMDLEDDK